MLRSILSLKSSRNLPTKRTSYQEANVVLIQHRGSWKATQLLVNYFLCVSITCISKTNEKIQQRKHTVKKKETLNQSFKRHQNASLKLQIVTLKKHLLVKLKLFFSLVLKLSGLKIHILNMFNQSKGYVKRSPGSSSMHVQSKTCYMLK